MKRICGIEVVETLRSEQVEFKYERNWVGIHFATWQNLWFIKSSRWDLDVFSSIIKPRVETLGYNNAVPLGLRNENGYGILEAIILVLIYRKQKSYKLSRSYKTCVS